MTSKKQKPFTEVAAEVTGKTQREIQRELARGKKSAPEVKEAWAKEEIGPTQVDELIRAPSEKQPELLAKVKGKSRDDTRAIIDQAIAADEAPVPEPSPKESKRDAVLQEMLDENYKRLAMMLDSSMSHLTEIVAIAKELGQPCPKLISAIEEHLAPFAHSLDKLRSLSAPKKKIRKQDFVEAKQTKTKASKKKTTKKAVPPPVEAEEAPWESEAVAVATPLASEPEMLELAPSEPEVVFDVDPAQDAAQDDDGFLF